MDERAEDKAYFCLITGIAPSEYDRMTVREQQMFIKVSNKLNSK